MNFNFFKGKKKKNDEFPLSEKELLINSIGIDKIKKICDNLFIDMENISLYLLNILRDNPIFLEYVLNNYLFYDLGKKINNGTIKLRDIDADNFQLLEYPIFDINEKEKINILRKVFLTDGIKNKKYFCVNSNNLINQISHNKKVEKKFNSYFDDIEIVMNMDIVSVDNNFSYNINDITYLFVNDSFKYNFDIGYYFDNCVNFDNDTIVIMCYDKFLNLNDDEVKILSNYNLVILEDYKKISQLYNSISMNCGYREENDIFDHNRIMVNHLLYCVSNSILTEERKKYYSYYISNYYLSNMTYYIYDYAKRLENEIGIDKILNLTKEFNNLSTADKMNVVKEVKYDSNVFIANLDDIDKISAFSLLYEIGKLNSMEKRIVLGDSLIKKKLRNGLLEESKSDQYRYYDKILKILDVSEFLSLYDKDFLNNFFQNGYSNGSKYKFFVSLCQKDFNRTVEYLLNDDGLFEEFFNENDNFYSLFYNLDYELLLKCILKIENGKKEYRNDFACCIPEEYQKRLFEENLKDSTIVWLLPVFKEEVISDFFQNDPRALYLFSKFNIGAFINQDKPILFNDEILKKDEFFELLKSDSFVRFRANINNIEKHNNPMIIEEKRKKYSSELINSYGVGTGLFKAYTEILDNPSKLNEVNYREPYIMNRDIYNIIRNSLRYSDDGNYYFRNKENLLSLLKRETSLRLGEIIVDDLFEDNIYNVWINIKEMIRYNGSLEDGEKVLNSDKLEIYDAILNIDAIENDGKIKLYNSLKDKNFNLIFYEDLRKLKDVAYDEIKNNMFNVNNHSECISELSDKYGVTIYDLRDKKFTMLVRRMSCFYEKSIYKRGCYSIISDENTDVFYGDSNTMFTYGYNSFENDRVVHMFEGDSYSADSKDNSSRYVNRIMTARELVNAHRWYSEVQILNEMSDRIHEPYNAKRPDFIVVFDEINDMAVNESKRLGIPIVMIKSKKLRDEDMVDINFDRDNDVYIDSCYGEKERRVNRYK